MKEDRVRLEVVFYCHLLLISIHLQDSGCACVWPEPHIPILYTYMDISSPDKNTYQVLPSIQNPQRVGTNGNSYLSPSSAGEVRTSVQYIIAGASKLDRKPDLLLIS